MKSNPFGLTIFENLLNGLSSFWTFIFSDKEFLEVLHQGSVELVSQAYLELLTSVLNQSLLDNTIFDKDQWKHFSIGETDKQLVKIKQGIGLSLEHEIFLYKVTDFFSKWGSASFIQNRMINPETQYKNKDVPTKTVKELLIDLDSRNNVSFSLGKYDVIKDYITDLSLISEDEVYIASKDDLFSDPNILSYEDSKTGENTLTLWATDTLVDNESLFKQFGSLQGVQLDSSQLYKNILLFLQIINVKGPNPRDIERAITILMGLPVIREEGEVLVKVSTDPYDRYILTDKHRYVIHPINFVTENINRNIIETLKPNELTITPRVKILGKDFFDQTYDPNIGYPDVNTNPNTNIGEDSHTYIWDQKEESKYTFSFLEPVTESILVGDDRDAPLWFVNEVIPKSVMPKSSVTTRTVTLVSSDPDAYRLWQIGDTFSTPEQYASIVPSVGQWDIGPTMNDAFRIFYYLLRNHIWYIRVNSNLLPEEFDFEKLTEALREARMSNTTFISL